MQKHHLTNKNSFHQFNKLKKVTSIAALAFLCTGCHFDSNVDIEEFRECSLQADLAIMSENIPVMTEPLTLEDIYEIASCRNLNLLVKQLEYEIQNELVTRERFGMLPDIKTHFERIIRNRNTASSSESLVPGVPPAPLSISSQKHQRRWDYALVWNYVDFGLAFLRSRQEYNRSIKIQFEYKRLQQNLFVDVTREYWKAQTAKLARNKSKAILERAKVQQAAVKKQLEAKIISEIQGLRNEGQLVAFQAQFQFYNKEYHTALSALALLMGLPPCIDFEIADVVSFGLDVCLEDICELESLALYYRPELFADDAEELIQRDEARAAVLQMFPGVDLFAGHNHDSNRFLLFNHWIQAGTRVAYNLLDWPRHLQESRAADGRVLLARNNRLLMSVSVMTQVHLAYTVYLDNLDSYSFAKNIEDINTRLVSAAISEKQQGKLHDADVLKYEIELLESQIDSVKQYGELQNSLEQLNNALGLPLYFTNSHEYGVIAEEHFITKKVDAEPASLDTDELRSIYLDFIIDKIEKEEEELHRPHGEPGQPEMHGDINDSSNEKVDQNQNVHQDDVEDNNSEDADEEDKSTSINDIIRKYQNNDEVDSSSDGNVEEDTHKYSNTNEYDDTPKEDNNAAILSKDKKLGFFIFSFDVIVDAFNNLLTRAKSIL